jgi:DNA-binding transcriptional LysR family regulator
VDVELRQLQSLLAVAEERSFTAAARRLHLTQQSVSALVRRLEVTLGVTLFERTTRSVQPTAACEELLPAVKAALRTLDSALTRTRLRNVQEPPLRLAFTPATALGGLQCLLEAMSAAGLPDPEVREVWADELVEAVREGRYDAAIGIEVHAGAGLDVQPWRRQRIDLLVASTHPFASQDHVTVAQLAGAALVLPDRKASAGLHDKLVAAMTRAGVEPSIASAPRTSRTAPVAVERGVAATTWLTGMDDQHVPNGFVHVPLREPEVLVTTDFVTRVGAGSSAQASLDVLREVIERTSGL